MCHTSFSLIFLIKTIRQTSYHVFLQFYINFQSAVFRSRFQQTARLILIPLNWD